MKNLAYIAHHREIDGYEQSVEAHLRGVSLLAERYASKINVGLAGAIIGLVHDFGKFSSAFQSYLRSATGLIDPDDDAWVDSFEMKGKVDHSTAGAQLIWNVLANRDSVSRFIGQVLSLCVASHHSGLIDCLTVEGEDNFTRRILKSSSKTNLVECEQNVDAKFLNEIQTKIADPELISQVRGVIYKIMLQDRRNGVDSMFNTVVSFKLGLFVRFLFSCLIDADRTDTADFENPRGAKQRQFGDYRSWEILINRLESHLKTLPVDNSVNETRGRVSRHCLERSLDSQGLFTLTVPTGGGKTLASLRFALHHAQLHKMDRVIYVTPFTSIIDQNAQVARAILECSPTDEFGSVVLEHHSNLSPERETWKAKLLSENWDAPVVFTTSVQFLESLFGSGTREVRRMHQLANAVIVFDEIQTMPVRCVHMFCNALNFLIERCGTTAVLCTATQPLLNNLKNTNNGVLKISQDREIIPDVPALFRELKRVEIVDITKSGGWSVQEIAKLAVNEMRLTGSCLLIVNTKKVAKELFQLCGDLTENKKNKSEEIFHLSTSMCPAHRMEILEQIRNGLDKKPLICVSTQLIEAGVDVDFGTVVRFATGMDSIVQAAGRCNRNGRKSMGRTFIVNYELERIDSLSDIKIGKEKTIRLLSEFNREPGALGGDLMNPEVLERYFAYYFYDRSDEMSYPVSAAKIGRDDNLLNLLSTNERNSGSIEFEKLGPAMRQSFLTAAKAFQAIDSSTQGVIVPYGTEGKKIIGELSGAFDIAKQFKLIKSAQRYTVNVFSNVLKKLEEAEAVSEVQTDSGILFLNERFYSNDFGLSVDSISGLEACVV